MTGNFVVYVIFLFLFWRLALATRSIDHAVSMKWHYVGKGCFKYDFYTMVLAKTIDDCKKKCLDDVKCALVAYRKKNGKCALCSEGYKHSASCSYHVELVTKDIDECAIGVHNCEEDAVCVNKPGGFECRCKDGYYKGSGQHCIPVPHVEWIRYEDSCLEITSSFTVIVVSNVNECKLKCQISDRCAMVEYRGHNKKCKMSRYRKFKPIASCKSRTDVFVKAIIECDEELKKCQDYAYCRAKDGDRLCRCRFGYRGNGKICNDVNECTTYSNLCGQHAECRNTIGSYKCVCVSGYHGDGQLCRKDKAKKEGVTISEGNDKGAFRTIINLFTHSGSHCNSARSQVVAFVTLLAVFIVRHFQS